MATRRHGAARTARDQARSLGLWTRRGGQWLLPAAAAGDDDYHAMCIKPCCLHSGALARSPKIQFAVCARAAELFWTISRVRVCGSAHICRRRGRWRCFVFAGCEARRLSNKRCRKCAICVNDVAASRISIIFALNRFQFVIEYSRTARSSSTNLTC